jgi:hypothetical protein
MTVTDHHNRTINHLRPMRGGPEVTKKQARATTGANLIVLQKVPAITIEAEDLAPA